jgi:alkylation response protein AidB-like acyl-CoA dehydrogenase
MAATKPDGDDRGLVALVVDRDAEGVKIEKSAGTLGVRAADTVNVVFENAKVPVDRLLGEGRDCLEDAQSVTAGARVNMAAMACGLGRAAMETSIAYAQERQQFDRPIAAFQAIQWKVANMAADLQAAWCMTLNAAHLRDVGQPFALAASRAQIFAARAATRAGSEALQVHGGYGYTREYFVERFLRDARMCSLALESSERLRGQVSHAIRGRFAGA